MVLILDGNLDILGYDNLAHVYSKMAFVVLILDGNPEISAHVWSDLGYLTCVSHSYCSRAVTHLICFLRAQHDLTYHLIQVYHGSD